MWQSGWLCLLPSYLQARRAIGDSSVLAAGSEGTVGTVTLSGARCMEGTAHLSQGQPHPASHPLLGKRPQEQEQADDGHQRPDKVPDKRQKTQRGRPEALAGITVTAEQQPAVRDDGSLLRSPPPVETKLQPERTQDPLPQQAEDTLAQAMTRRVGRLGMDAIRDTLMRQQTLFTEQVRFRAAVCLHVHAVSLLLCAACSLSIRSPILSSHRQ